MVQDVTRKPDLPLPTDSLTQQPHSSAPPVPSPVPLVDPGHPGGGAEPQGLTEVIKQVADELQKTDAQLQMEVDSDLGRVIVKVLDGQTGQVIRQIPAQELVNLAKQLKSLNGLLVEKHA